MNKFGNPDEEDFEIVSGVIEEMVKDSPGLISAREQRI
jgi:hypothetical protein